MQWSPMLDLCWQRDTYSDIGRSILPLTLTWIEFQRLRLEMIRRTFNIRSTAKPRQLLWKSCPIPGGAPEGTHSILVAVILLFIGSNLILLHFSSPQKVLVGDLKPAKGQLGGDSSLCIHSTVNGRS